MRRILLLLALMAGVIAPAISASSASADDNDAPPGLGIRLVDVPVAAADNPRARVYIIDHVKPGIELERRVQIVNNTDDAARVSAYPAAADIEAGSFTGAEGHSQNELSTWTSVTPSSVRLDQGDRTFAEVTIKVPADAAPGEQYAVVWAEITTPPATPGGLTQVSRVGIRIYLSVGAGGEPASDFAIRAFTAERDDAGSPVVQVMVRNTGGRALDLTGDLRLSDGPGGLSAGPFEMTLGTTLGIGQTEPVTVALDEKLPDGPWRAHVTVRSGLLERRAAATLTFPQGPGAAAPVAAESDGGAPWLVILAVAGGALLLALAWFLLRRRAARRSGGRRVLVPEARAAREART